MTEPKRIEDALVGYTGPKNAVFSLRLRIDADCEFCGTKPHNPCQHTPNEAFDHPAPAPAEHTAADAPNREAGSSTDSDKAPSQSAAGVPDVISRLIECCKAWEPSVCILGNVRAGEAATALAALQSQLNLRVAHGWIADAAGKQQDEKIAQQAERINELEAELNLAENVRTLDVLELQRKSITELKETLDEAVRLIELSTAKGTTHCGWYAERDAFLNKAREVMG